MNRAAGERHREVSAVKRKLYQRALEIAHLKDARERSHQRIGDIVRKTPERKEQRYQDKRYEDLSGYHSFSTHSTNPFLRMMLPYFLVSPVMTTAKASTARW